MKKTIYIALISLLSSAYCLAQSTLLIDRSKEGQSNNTKVESQKSIVFKSEKVKSSKKDTSNKKLSAGFTLTAILAGNRGLASGSYALRDNNTSSNKYYSMNNAFGFRAGLGIGFQTKSYGFEVPITYNKDRFKVPTISTSSKLKLTSLEFGINNYFKFLKEKHYIVLGPYFAFDLAPVGFGLHSAGFNLGYGYSFTKRLNLSLRYKFNINSISKQYPFDDNTSVGITHTSSNNVAARYAQYNSLQLVLRFDMVNTRRYKEVKQRVEAPKPVVRDNTSAPVKKNPTDYSKFSLTELQNALKSSRNIEEMTIIQNEIDKRKSIGGGEFDKYSDTQLKELLNTSVAKEDYDRAEIIKNEISKREKAKAASPPVNPNSLENKTLDELNALLNAALAKEDYDKAAEIQEVIKKKQK